MLMLDIHDFGMIVDAYIDLVSSKVSSELGSVAQGV